MENETDLIMQRAQTLPPEQHRYGIHFLSRVTVMDYVRIADEIARVLPRGRILDWGCGFGQVSFLLARRGLDVVSYDYAAKNETTTSPVFPEIKIQYGDDPVNLPYADASFDAVLSCGVLEHVPDEAGSLSELARVLKPHGYFFIYNLPQQDSYKEFLLEKFRLAYTHERKYTLTRARRALAAANFKIIYTKRSGFFPHNLSVLPRVRPLYNAFARPVLAWDKKLSALPGFSLIAEAIEITAVKKSNRE